MLRNAELEPDFNFLPKGLILYLISRELESRKAKLLSQGNELKGERALASGGHETGTPGFEPGARVRWSLVNSRESIRFWLKSL